MDYQQKPQGNFYPELPGATAPMGHPEPAPAYTMQPQPMPQQVVTMQAPTQFGPQPVRTQCPSCHATQMTQIEFANSTKTHLFATILCLTTCCCCIPYCIDSCKNANHHCGQCGAYLGTYQN